MANRPVLGGPDRRGAITDETRDILFAVSAPAGAGEEAVRRHLHDVPGNVLLVARTEALVTPAA